MLIDVFQSPTSTELRDILKDQKIKTQVNQMVNEYLVHFMDPGSSAMDSALTVDALGEEMEIYQAKALGLGANPHDELLNTGKEKMLYLWKQGKPFSAMKFVTFYGWHCNRLASQPASALRKRPRPPTPIHGGAGKRFFTSHWAKKVPGGPHVITKLPVQVARMPIVKQHDFVPLDTIEQSPPLRMEDDPRWHPDIDPFMRDAADAADEEDVE